MSDDRELVEFATSARASDDDSFEAAGEFRPGERIPGTPYTVRRRLGRGGHATVYECTNTIGREVAVKVILHHLAKREELMARMVEEASRTVQLHHPNIVEVYTAGVTTGPRPLAYIEMERLVGGNGRQLLLSKKRLHVAHVVDILIDVCRALHRAHKAGIVHQDLKPDNVFIHSDEWSGKAVTKLLDFGISKYLADAKVGGLQPSLKDVPRPELLRAKEGAPSSEKIFEGTIAYAAPEQLEEEGIVTFKTDLYALGVIAYELLTGRRPYEEAEAKDKAAQEHHQHSIAAGRIDEFALSRNLMTAILTDPVPRLGDVADILVPREFEDLVMELLRRDPNARPASAQGVETRLQSIKKLKGLDKAAQTTQEMLITKMAQARGPVGKGQTLRMQTVGEAALPVPGADARDGAEDNATVPDPPTTRGTDLVASMARAVREEQQPAERTGPSGSTATGVSEPPLGGRRRATPPDPSTAVRTGPLPGPRRVGAAERPDAGAVPAGAVVGTFEPVADAHSRAARSAAGAWPLTLRSALLTAAAGAFAAAVLVGGWRVSTYVLKARPEPAAKSTPAPTLRPLPEDPPPSNEVFLPLPAASVAMPPSSAPSAPFPAPEPRLASSSKADGPKPAAEIPVARPGRSVRPVPAASSDPLESMWEVRPSAPTPPPKPSPKPARRPAAPAASSHDPLLDWLDRSAKPKSGL